MFRVRLRSARSLSRRAVSLLLCVALVCPAIAPAQTLGAAPGGRVREAASRYATLAREAKGVSSARLLPEAKAGTRVVVEWAPGIPDTQIAAAAASLGFSVIHEEPAVGAALVAPKRQGVSAQRLADALRARRLARSARVEQVYRPSAVRPNDPLFAQQWALENTGQTGGRAGADIGATRAWVNGTGSKEIVVAVVDTGIDIHHPDLVDAIWVNTGEIPDNGLDDDNNGYADDVNGYDFSAGNATVYDPADGDQHGTHVAGSIGAVGDNGIGISGVSQRVTIMPVKFLGPWGGGEYEGALALRYAVDNGARVINCSWGGGPSKLIGDALDYAAEHGVLVVCAAGNWGMDLDSLTDFKFYPSSYDSTAVISVAATDDSDRLARFSNYGVTEVDVAAPGVDVTSTLPFETTALLVEKLPYKIAYLAFAPEAIEPAATGRETIARSMSRLMSDRKAPVLLVDDSAPQRTGETPGVRQRFYRDALSGAGYSDVTVWSTSSQGTPRAADLRGRVVVWFTGSDAGGWYSELCISDAERTAIAAYLDGGGRLLMASGEIGTDLGYWSDPEWFEKYFHARTVAYETWGYEFEGVAGTIFEGLSGALASAYRWPDGYDSRRWPTGSDSVIPADRFAKPLASMGGYGILSGTSMAAPHVTGAAALLMAQRPGIATEDVRARIENTVDAVASLADRVGYGGRIDVADAAGTYVGRPVSIEPTAAVRPLQAGSVQAVSWKMPTGAAPGATFELQQGLPFTAYEEGFEYGVPIRFTTPPGSHSWYVTQDLALVRSGGAALRSRSMNPAGSVKVVAEERDESGGFIFWEISGYETSTVEAKVDVPEGGGTLSFWWKMDAMDQSADFMVDGEYVDWLWPLPVPWRRVQVNLSSGEHTLRWTIGKAFGDFTYGNDCVAIDDIKLVANAFRTVGVAPAGSRSMGWSVPAAESGNVTLRLRSKTATQTSPWAYTRGLRVSRSLFAPAPPGRFVAQAGTNGDIRLSWTNPPDADFAGVRVVRRVGVAPSGAEDSEATVVYEGTATVAADAGLVHGDRVFYHAYAWDRDGNLSNPASADARIVDTVAPATPRGVDATVEDGFVGVSWMSTEPSGSASVRVARIAPGDAGIDGPGARPVYDGPGAHAFDYELSRVPTHTVAHYGVQAADGSGNRSSVVTVSVAVDTRGPRGSITVAGGADSVSAPEVDVSMRVTRAVEMRFNGGLGWGEWVRFSPTAQVKLRPVEGRHVVRGQFRDVAGVVREFRDDVYLNVVAPPTPRNLRAAPAPGGARLEWDASTTKDLMGYHVYRSASPDGPFKRVGRVPGTPAEPMPRLPMPAPEPGPGMPDKGTGSEGVPSAPATPTVRYLAQDLEAGMTYYFSVVAVDRGELVSARSAPVAVAGRSITRRIAGADHADTAVLVSRSRFTTAPVVVVARADRTADQVVAVALAGAYRSPLLLAKASGFTTGTVAELQRLGARTVIAVGADDALSTRLRAAVPTDTAVRALTGPDRAGTAALVAREIASAEATPSRTALLVSGSSPTDALGLLPMAYAQRIPVLFADRAGLPAATAAVIDDLDFDAVRVAGGESRIPEYTLESQLGWLQRDRLEGSNAVEIAVTVARLAQESRVATFGTVAIVNTRRPAEAVAGAIAAATRGGVIVVTSKSRLPQPSADLLRENLLSIERIKVYGPTAALDGAGKRSLRAALRWLPEPWGMMLGPGDVPKEVR